MFSILCRNPLNFWLKREIETGDYKASVNYQKGKEQKIKNLSKFEEFALEHQDKTQGEIAELIGEIT